MVLVFSTLFPLSDSGMKKTVWQVLFHSASNLNFRPTFHATALLVEGVSLRLVTVVSAAARAARGGHAALRGQRGVVHLQRPRSALVHVVLRGPVGLDGDGGGRGQGVAPPEALVHPHGCQGHNVKHQGVRLLLIISYPKNLVKQDWLNMLLWRRQSYKCTCQSGKHVTAPQFLGGQQKQYVFTFGKT